MSQHVCSEIMYDGVHSDLCGSVDDDGFPVDVEWRVLLHGALDEWLDKAGGKGIFYVGDLMKVQV